MGSVERQDKKNWRQKLYHKSVSEVQELNEIFN